MMSASIGLTSKAQLIEALSERLGDDKNVAAQAVDGLVGIIIRTVNKGEKANITGFGVFEKCARAARTARNPRTGEAVKVKKTNVPAFRAGTTFKDVISGSKKLPKATPVKRATAASTTTRAATAKASASAKDHQRPRHLDPCGCRQAGQRSRHGHADPRHRGEAGRQGHRRQGDHNECEGRRQTARRQARRGEETGRCEGPGQAHLGRHEVTADRCQNRYGVCGRTNRPPAVAFRSRWCGGFSLVRVGCTARS
ncbi:hypothetical protein Amsp01_048500 [Amycolatopsis sp. NBRC 101858]|nr:hypothetical protein Amsp01_048500 [Amycolatopsis sp. NBRC 101858]